MVLFRRDAAAVVDDLDDVAGQERDLDMRADAGERLVDGVVDDLVDEMVQSRDGGRADVHAGTLAHGLEPLEHLDLRLVIDLRDVQIHRLLLCGRGGLYFIERFLRDLLALFHVFS